MKRLILEVLRRRNAAVRLLLYERLGFFGREGLAEKLVNCVQIYRQRKHLAPGRRFDSMYIWLKLYKSVDVRPNIFVTSVEDMRAICMQHYPRRGISFGMAISCYMRALFVNLDGITLLGE